MRDTAQRCHEISAHASVAVGLYRGIHALKLLLYTHALLWYTLDNHQLSQQAESFIRNAANDVYVNPPYAGYFEGSRSFCLVVTVADYAGWSGMCSRFFSIHGLLFEKM